MNLPNSEIDQFRSYLVGDFELQLFEATLVQVGRPGDPLRANNFAYALRELSRHVLKRLAPDDETRNAPWFIQDPDYAGITRPQRMKFAIQGHLEDDFLNNTLGIDYDTESKVLKTEIDNLSKFTHVEPETFNVPQHNVDTLTHGSLQAFANLFQSMFDCRERVLNSLSEEIDEEVVFHAMEETLEVFWEYATHYALDEIVIENIELSDFDGDEIVGHVSGTVSVILQYGSSGDRARGDGLESSASADFGCDIHVLASDLTSVKVVEGTFSVNDEELSRSWRGADDEYLEGEEG